MRLWEVTFYLGLLGTAFILFFGLYRILRNPGSNPYSRLWLPCFGLLLLSFNQVYGYLRELLPFPPLTGERVASRMFSLVFVFALCLAAIEFQKWLDGLQRRQFAVAITFLLLAFNLHDLFQNYYDWMIGFTVSVATLLILIGTVQREKQGQLKF